MLLDTHVLLWAVLEPERLGPKARRLIQSQDCLVSSISAQEIARLVAIGRIQRLKAPLSIWLDNVRTQLGFEWIEVTVEDAVESYALPHFAHKDPCDRLIIASARRRGIALLTADQIILSYAHTRAVDASA